MDWLKLNPNPPFYLFMPQEQAYREEYEAGRSVNEIFPVFALGLNSHRDHFAIAYEKQEIINRFASFRDNGTNQECYARYGLTDNRDWQLPVARAMLQSNSDWQSDVIPCLYRPYDVRYCLLNEVAMDYPRLDVNRNMLLPNLSLVTTRQTREPFAALATNLVCGQHKIVSVYDGSYIFPLWRYPTKQEAVLGMEREANLSPKFLAEVKERIGETPTPEDIFQYIYAVFHAPTYRTRYAAFLKTDFPRLPLPPDGETFHALTALGAKLVALHLLEDPALQTHGIGFPVPGSHEVKKMRVGDRYIPPEEPTPPPEEPTPPPEEPTPAQVPTLPQREGRREEDTGFVNSTEGSLQITEVDDALPARPPAAGGPLRSKEVGSVGRVRLNDAEYFDNVPPEAWEFRVGGYQPAAKWLDDRAGRMLTADDITHYRRMIAAMRETSALLPQVDVTFLTLLAKNAEPTGEPNEE